MERDKPVDREAVDEAMMLEGVALDALATVIDQNGLNDTSRYAVEHYHASKMPKQVICIDIEGRDVHPY